ncbi:MAG: tetratricopeptide repeat protein [Candidatus Brocadiales bacterium]|nr:tetratricopeptide repeat protein [Candidatus Bathyanammoxibius sp.]
MTEIHRVESSRFHLGACLIIIIAGLIVYSNTIHSSFQFDDYEYIVNNPLIRDLHNVPEFFQKNGISFASRGVVTTSFAINHYFSGLSVESYHWVNISIHLVNGMLVYFLAIIILKQFFPCGSGAGNGGGGSSVRILALFVALFFVTSPIQTHQVTYIFQRNGLTASFFYLSSLLLFIKAVNRPGIRVYLYGMSVVSFLFGIWSKEMACTAPVIMFLYYQCFITRDWRSPRRGIKLILPYIMVWAVSFYFGVVRNVTLEQISDWTFWEYLVTQSNVLIAYIKLLLLPLPGRFNVDVDFPLAGTLWEFPTLLSAVSIVAILITAVLYLERARPMAFCILWFFVILAPTSGLVPVMDIMVSYRLYLPGLGFYLLMVVGIHKALCYAGEKNGLEPKLIRLVELAVFITIVLFYGVSAHERNKVWQTEITLWTDAVQKSPDKIRPHFNLGRCYQKEGQTMKAWKQYFICKTIHAKMPEIRNGNELRCASAACNNLAMIYFDAGLHDTAVTILKEAIRIYPKSTKAHRNLGDAYVYTGRLDEAEAEYKLDIRLDPRHSRSYSGLGVVYENKGMLNEAVDAYTKALKTESDNTEVRIRLGELWLNHKRNPGKAMHYLREALKVSGDRETTERIKETIRTVEKHGLPRRPGDMVKNH